MAIDEVVLEDPAAGFDRPLQIFLLEVLISSLGVRDRLCRNEADGIFVDLDGDALGAGVKDDDVGNDVADFVALKRVGKFPPDLGVALQRAVDGVDGR